MKKFMVRILCCFVPGSNNRHKIREYFLATKPQIEFFTKNDLNEQITNLQTNITNLKNELCDMIYHDVHRLIATAELHKQTFAGYRNKFAGKTVVLVGAGPCIAVQNQRIFLTNPFQKIPSKPLLFKKS